MPLVDITNENFDDLVDAHSLMLLDFWAPWCAPCKAFTPVYEAAAEKFPGILFGRVNTDEQPELAKQFEVRSIPTILGAKDGTIVQVKVGAMNPQSLAKLIEDIQR